MRTALALGLAAVVSVSAVSKQTSSKSAGTSIPKGYLAEPAREDSLQLSPPPPAPASVAEARDIESSQSALRLRGSARWALATADADLFKPTSGNALSCAAGIEISEDLTPKLNTVLRRTAVDLGQSTSLIKNRYKRPRPFMINNEASCTPDAEPGLRLNGAYPSGHSAIGYGWGLILAELLPDRANQIVARGRAFGDSRRVCNVHWLSDVEEGRIVAAAAVARLHSDPAFRKDMDAARLEIAKSRTSPTRDCAAEAAALALSN